VRKQIEVHKASERQLQSAVADWLALALPPDAFFSSIGHGGGGKVRGALLKRTGLKAGVPDLLVIADGRARFIELKTAKGRLSPAQREAHDALVRAGALVAVCRSIEDVAAQISAWGIPTRAKVA